MNTPQVAACERCHTPLAQEDTPDALWNREEHRYEQVCSSCSQEAFSHLTQRMQEGR